MGWFTLGGTPDGEIQYLYVGRLDGRAFRAVVADGAIKAAGPHQGRVLAWWRDGDRSLVALIDTADGSSRVVLETDDFVEAASFGPDDDMYWVTGGGDDGDDLVVWRRDLEGGTRERVGGSFSGKMAFMTPSDDLRRIAVWSISDEGTRTYRVLDTREGAMTRLPADGYGGVMGFLGARLLVYGGEPAEEGWPLIAISADGEARTLAHTRFIAEVYPDSEGDGQLVSDAWTDGEYRVLARSADGADARVIHTTLVADPFYASPRLMRRFEANGIETRGWVPVLPGGMPLHDASTDIEEYRGMDRALVSLDGAPTVALGPEPEVQPAPPA